MRKGCTPPSVHVQPLLLAHSHTLPLCVGRSTHVAAPVAPPGLPALPCPARRPPLHAGGCRRDSAPLVPSSRAMPHARGRAACKGRGKDQGGCMQGEGLHARGGGGTKGGVCKGKGHMQGKGEDQGGCAQGEWPDTRGRGGCARERVGLCMNGRGCTPFPHPLHPVD